VAEYEFHENYCADKAHIIQCIATIAFRPCETAVSISSRCGSQAPAEGFARAVNVPDRALGMAAFA
jgi:hypothetical protein